MITVQTTIGNKYEAIAAQKEAISTADGNVICETESGNAKHFVAPTTCVHHSDSEIRLINNTIRKRHLRLLKKHTRPVPEIPVYTELEYLETSGTQWIQTEFRPGVTTRLRAEFDASASPEYGSVYSAQAEVYVNSADSLYDATFRPNGGLIVRPFRTTNWRSSSFGHAVLEVTGSSVLFNGEVMVSNYTPDSGIDDVSLMKMFTHRLVLKFYSLRTWDEHDNVLLDLIPVLNADGVPGLWDKARRQFLGNAGTGNFGYALRGAGERSTYSLRNRSVVPPSGVYARMSEEKGPEVIADTEECSGEGPSTPEGWVWFANAAEAYEHFGIAPEREEI